MQSSKLSPDVIQIIETQLSVPTTCILHFFVSHSNQDCIMSFYHFYGNENTVYSRDFGCKWSGVLGRFEDNT